MGLTHYWQRPTELPADAFAKASADCRKAMAAMGIALSGFDGTGKPLFKKGHIVFNGGGGAKWEPFEIRQTEFDRHGRPIHWSFCKTGHAPYDICVRVALVILKEHLGDVLHVGSDAKQHADWNEARELCAKIVGYGDDFELDPPEIS